MQREDMVLKLLELGPTYRADLVLDTGWGIQETNAVIDRLLADARVAFYPQNGNNQKGHCRGLLCLPQTREQALELSTAAHRQQQAARYQARRA